MKITNRANLPDALVRAVTNDPYVGGGDISTTTLIGPPQIHYLRRKHENEIEEDVLDRIWSLLGQAVHTILERAEQLGLPEERLYMPVLDWKLSGQFDRLVLTPTGLLQDYKVTSTWTSLGPKPEWENQLNVLAHLCRYNGVDVGTLEIVAIYRDWSRAQALRSPDYPRYMVEIIPIKLWTPDEAQTYIEQRVKLHQSAILSGNVPPCSNEERWYRGEEWAVTKAGRKSALRCLSTEAEATAWAIQNNHFKADGTATTGISVVHRPGKNVRCESYCSVSPFCHQYTDLQNR